MIGIEYSYLSTSPKRFETNGTAVIIGRESEDGFVDLDLLPDVTASRRHALITYRDDSFWIEDLGSRSGTWINDQRIAKKIAVTASDQIKIGQTTLRLYRPDLDASVEALADSEPNYPQSDENLLEQGSFTSSVSAMQSPSDLLLARQGDASLDIVKGRLSAFYELGTALGTAQSVEPLLKIVVNHLCKAIPGAQRGALFLLNDRKLYLKAYSPERSKPSVSLYLARLAIEKQEAFTWRYDAPGEMNRLSDSILGHGIRCAMYAPLIWQDQVLGIAYVDNYRTSDAFTREDLRLLMAMVSQATVFVKNHSLQKALRHQQVIRSNLLRQFSPQVVDHLEALLQKRGHLGLGGEHVEPVTVLNSDVRGFTALSADMDPGEVMEMLNQLFGVCIPIIFKYNGTVDKYIGDAILAVFGTPDPEARDKQWIDAVRAAVEMQRAVRRLGRQWKTQGRPVFEIGIGIHTGAVLQGFIGSNEQMEYTVIGDTVNRTSRYCNGAGRGEIVISPEVYRRVQGIVEAQPKTILAKYPGIEDAMEAYLVSGFGT